MYKNCFQGFLLVLCLCFATFAANAQEVVHALTGTVTSINPATKTLQINTDDGSDGRFTTVIKPGVSLDFSKTVQAEAIPASSFTKTNTRVLLYYIGDSDVRVAVAMEDLGQGPFVKSQGTVLKVDRHAHLLTIENASGARETFHVTPKTVAEAAEGVEQGDKFEADKGERVRVTAKSDNGSETALFIRSL
jgi:hypothetical protein